MKGKLVVGSLVLFFIILSVLTYRYVFIKDFVYYTQIDNSKLEKVDSNGGVFDKHGGMKYEYNLEMYDKNGKSKKIKLGTNRELKEDAFLKVYYYFLRGVHKWEEIEYDDLPSKVKDHFKKWYILLTYNNYDFHKILSYTKKIYKSLDLLKFYI